MGNLDFDKFAELFKKNEPTIGRFALTVVIAIIVYFIVSKIIRWVCRLLEKQLIKSSMPKETRTFLVSFSKVTLYLLLVLGIASQFGISQASVAALVASGGVAIGLALQGGLSNLAAGVIIIFAKPFVAGDYIIESTRSYEGEVKKIELYYTTIATIENQLVIIPNSVLTSNIVINKTAMQYRRIEMVFGIYYEADLKQVKKLLYEILQNDEDIIQDKEINVFVLELSDQTVKLGLWAWTKTENCMVAGWRLNEKIKETFDREGIKFNISK